MITIEQCRAARGLLDWTQQDLAQASGLSKTAINNFEKGHSDIKYESLKALRLAFEGADIEFIGEDGIRRKSETMRILKGPDAARNLLDDVYETLKAAGGEILMSHVGNKRPGNSSKQFAKQLLRIKNSWMKERIICSEDFMKELAPLNINCRCLPDDSLQSGLMTAIYGTKVGIEFWGGSMIAIIESAEACAAERERFEILWHSALVPSASAFSVNRTTSKE